MEMKLFGMSCRLEIIIISLIVGAILGTHLLCSCSKISLQEGLSMINGASLDWDMQAGQPGSWTKRADSYAKEMGYSTSESSYAQNIGTPVPLPEGQLFMFADNKFTPECCPAGGHMNSMGCVCMSSEQVNYLAQRGGNRTFPSEY